MRESYVEVSNGRMVKVQKICPLNELKNTYAYHLGLSFDLFVYITLTICLAFSTTARSFGSESIMLPFSFSERNLSSLNFETDSGSKLSKSFLQGFSNKDIKQNA